jgi:amino acid adenylation domain-containing protein
MSAYKIIKECHLQGVNLKLVNDEIKVSAKKGAMSQSLLVEIKKHRQDIISLLRKETKLISNSYNKLETLTISDFPHARLSATDLNLIQQNYSCISKLYIATPMQEGMLFHGFLDGSGASYTSQTYCDLNGPLDVSALKKAWQKVVERYDIFRTCFVNMDQGKIHQLVLDKVTLPIAELDWRNLSEQEQASALVDFQAKDKADGFDFSTAPLMRLTIICLADNRHHFIWTHHHVLTDGWCKTVIFGETMQIYQDLIAGRRSQLPKVAPFENYIRWLYKQEKQEALDFWGAYLSDFSSTTPLMMDKLVKAKEQNNLAELSIDFNEKLSARIDALVKQSHCTMNVILQAAWSYLLHRYSGELDIVFGATVSGRPADIPGIEHMIGLFINSLPIRVKFTRDITLKQLLQNVHSTNTQCNDYAYLSLAEIQKLSPIVNGTSLFDSLIVFYNFPVAELVDGKSKNQPDKIEIDTFGVNERTSYPLTIKGSFRNNLNITFEYDSERFSAEIMTQALSHLEKILILMVDGGLEQRVCDIDILSKKEKQTLLCDWNTKSTPPENNILIHELFEQQAKLRPDQIAIVFEDIHLSYKQLDQKSNQLAHYLRDSKVGIGSLVGIALERSIEMVIGIMGILKAGAAYVPLDHMHPQARLDYMVRDSGIELLLTQSHLIDELPNQVVRCIPLNTIGDELAAYPIEPVVNENASSTDLAYVIYTSGSTGKPKGVMIEHEALVNRIDWMQNQYQITEGDKILQKTPFSFDVSVWEFMWTLGYGAQLIIAKPEGHKDPEYLAKVIELHSVSVLHFVPSMLDVFLNFSDCLFSKSVRYIFCSGEALSLETVTRLHKTAPHIQLDNLYGPTEAAIDVSYFCCDDIKKYDSVPIGKPIQNIQLYVLDPFKNCCPVGIQGELYIGGVGLARGYLNRKELTDKMFISNPFGSGRLYRTGDLVRWLPDGNIEYIGRIDHQIKIRGLRIELGEIESVISELDEVKQAVVVVKESTSGQKQLVSFIVADEPKNTTSKYLIGSVLQHLNKKLPDYFVPNNLVVLDELPLSLNGKIDRKALSRIDIKGQPENQYIAPNTELEKLLCAIWQKALKFDRVGVTDNYFSLGGDSIISIMIIAQANKQGIHFTVKDLFNTLMIRELSALICYKSESESESHFEPEVDIFSTLTTMEYQNLGTLIDANILEDAYPLSSLQQGMLLHSELTQNLGTYHDIFSYHIKEEWSEPHFVRALNSLIRQNELLRSLISTDGERPLHCIYKNLSAPLHVVDLRLHTSEAKKAALNEWFEIEKSSQFQLNNPLWSVVIHRLEDDIFQYSLCFHHALLDGWSAATLNTQLFNLYHQALRNIEMTEYNPLSYRYFISNELKSIDSSLSKNFWLDNLREVELPWWSGRLKKGSIEKNMLLTSEQSEQLKALSMVLGVPVSSIFLTAYMVLLSLLNGKQNIATSLVFNARPERIGAEKTLGLFLNALPFSMGEIKGSWCDLIQVAHKHLSEITEHRNYPLANVQQNNGIDFSAALFNYTNFHVYEDIEQEVEVARAGKFEETNYLFVLNCSKTIKSENYLMNFVLDSGLFDFKYLERIEQYFGNIINSILNEPNKFANSSSFISDEEKQQLLVNWSGNQVDYTEDMCVHELFEAQVKRTPNNIALMYENQQLTYRELDECSNQLASYLREKGVQNETLVGVAMNRGFDMVISVLAILKSGGSFVALDPNYPIERLKYIIQDSGVRLLLTQSHLTEQFIGVQCITLALDMIRDELNNYSREFSHDVSVQSNDLAYVIYTSGSTGLPKGVLIEHRSVTELLQWSKSYFSEEELSSVLASTSLCFDLSMFELFAPLSRGGCCVIVESILSLLVKDDQYDISMINTVPSAINSLLEENKIPASVITINLAGEALQQKLVNRLFDACELKRVVNLYGPSEDTTYSTAKTFTGHTNTNPSIGTAITNTRTYVFDERGQIVPIGVVGELYLGGSGLARGYLNQTDLTEEKFITNPFGVGKLYKTGDLVRYLADGDLEFIGRLDEQVKIRGFRVELGEIEQKIRACKEVESTVVLLKQKESGSQALVAYIKLYLMRESVVDSAEVIKNIKQFLNQSLPDFMVPNVFHQLDKLPLTENGKIDKKALLNFEDDRLYDNYVAPQSNTEQKLVSKSAALLDLEQSKVSITDNFFALGGHSLLAVKLCSEINKLWGIKFSIKTLYDASSFKELSFLIDEHIFLLAPDLDIDTLSEAELDRYLELTN